MDRPVTTLFMLMSVDGKISTGATDDLDVDKNFPKIAGLNEGLHQYYEIEQTTDLWTFNSGRVQAKIGVNTKEMPNKTPVSFAVLDNSHLNGNGIRYFCALSKNFVLVTLNDKHPAFSMEESNLHIICQKELSLKDTLITLKTTGTEFYHAFPYSERKGTVAESMQNKVDVKTREERAAVLRKHGQISLMNLYNKSIGKIYRVLSEKGNKGHTENYMLIHYDKNIGPNQFINVLVKKVENGKLYGEVVENSII